MVATQVFAIAMLTLLVGLQRTPLHLAVLGGHLDMLLLLLAEEANPNVIGRHLDHVASGVGSPHDDPREEGYVAPVTFLL